MGTINKTSIKNYWQNKLIDYEYNNILPYDFPISGNISRQVYSFKISGSLFDKLIRISNNSDPLLFLILLAGVNTIIRKISFKNKFYNIIPVAKQESSDKLLNKFIINKWVIETNSNFRTILSKTREEIIESTENQNYPLYRFLSESASQDENKKTLFDIAILLSNIHSKEYLNEIDINLLFSFKHCKNSIEAELEYDGNKYSVATIQAICNGYLFLINNLIDSPESPIDSINIVDRCNTGAYFNERNTGCDNNNVNTVLKSFKKIVSSYPEKDALIIGEKRISFKMLDEFSNKLCNFLKEKGIKPGDIIGVQTKPSAEFIISLIAIIKTGGVYLPIDHEYPTERVNYILDQNKIKIILTDSANSIYKTNSLFVSIENIAEYPQYQVEVVDVVPEDILYILYTSGSTGVPKGISISNKSALNYINWAVKEYTKGKEACFPLFTSISFDLTVTSIFVPLLSGNSIAVYADQNQLLSLERIIKDNLINKIKLTPSHLLFLNRILERNNSKSNIDTIIVGGEDLTYNTAFLTSKLFNHKVDIYNEYGPTEATVGCAFQKFNYEDKTTSVPIGKPIDNMNIYIINDHNLLCPDNIRGEIAISGIGLSSGYVQNSGLTSKKFIKPSFLRDEVVYKSGDLGRWNNKGILEYFGRIDDQVKINGFRIELEEIRQCILSFEEIEDAVIVLNADKEKRREIYAYYVIKEPLSKEQLITGLSKVLPSYMVPSKFIKIDKVPLTINGKVDYNLLKKNYQDKDDQIDTVPPQNDIEKRIYSIWSIVLERKDISIYDSFFNIGGNSIKLLEVVNRMETEFGIKLSVVDMFENHNISLIAKYLQKKYN